MRILVVDDDAAMRLLLSARLSTWGHTVAQALNGKDAWQRLNAEHFDLVLSDWNMPELDGLALCRLIRQSRRPVYLYVILCTANTRKSDFITGMDAGADDFVVKPIDFSDLRVRVRAAERILELQTELAARNHSLQTLNDKLTSAYQTIERDLQAASAMQLRLLPKKVSLNEHIRLDWLMIPSSFLAGDMLNYFMAGERLLVFYQLDVAGHGIPAALLSVTLHRVLLPGPGSPILRPGSDGTTGGPVAPAAVVNELNRRFQGDEDEYFTIIYGTFDTATREVRFCQAGHPKPIYVKPGQPPVALGEGGFPVGMWPAMEYEEISFRLDPGDRLFLYSDGITDCRNPEGLAYSEQNLRETLQAGSSTGLAQLLDTVRTSISNWRGSTEFADDLSLLAIESV